jgi:hypothetical protein
VCAAGCEVAVCLFVSVGVGDVCGFVAEGGEESVVLVGEVGSEGGFYGDGEGDRRYVLEHGARVTLDSHEVA